MDITIWMSNEKWSVSVLRYGCVRGFGRDVDKTKAVDQAKRSCDAKCRLLYKELKEQYEFF